MAILDWRSGSEPWLLDRFISPWLWNLGLCAATFCDSKGIPLKIKKFWGWLGITGFELFSKTMMVTLNKSTPLLRMSQPLRLLGNQPLLPPHQQKGLGRVLVFEGTRQTLTVPVGSHEKHPKPSYFSRWAASLQSLSPARRSCGAAGLVAAAGVDGVAPAAPGRRGAGGHGGAGAPGPEPPSGSF